MVINTFLVIVFDFGYFCKYIAERKQEANALINVEEKDLDNTTQLP